MTLNFVGMLREVEKAEDAKAEEDKDKMPDVEETQQEMGGEA